MGAIAKFKPRYKEETADLGLIDWHKLPAASSEWVNALRKRAQQSLLETGLPTPKLERWKYTNLPARLKKMSLAYADAQLEIDGMTEGASLFPKGMLHFPDWAKKMVEVVPVGHAKYGDMMLWQAANAYLKDGVILDVSENKNIEQPLVINLSACDGQFITPRYLMRIEAGATVSVIENQSGSDSYWANILSQIKIEKGATLYHYRFQGNSDESIITHNTHIEMEEGANYEAFTLTTGAGVSRNQIHAELSGENITCRLNGVNMLDGVEHADTTITVDHHAPNCNSYQDYRTVVADQAAGVFQGKIHVFQSAQKTDGFQMAKSLLLSGQATINTKPELEIYADDVKCSHGATTGRLDEEALFYLRSRGVPEKQARNLLIQAFVNEVIEEITNKDVCEQAKKIVYDWLLGKEK